MFNVVCCDTRRECRQCMHDIVTINSRANIPVVERLVYFTYEPPVPFDSNVSAERHFRWTDVSSMNENDEQFVY